ncbi:hypothetical protein ISCGN_004679 [Ixodes scapularis]
MRLRPRHTQGTVTPSPAATKLKKTQEGTKTPRSRRPVGIKEPRPGATASKMAPTANAFKSEPAAILPEDTQKDYAAPAHLTSRASGGSETERTAPAGFPSLLGAAASPTSPTQREDRSIAMRPERTMNEVPEPSTDIGRTSGPHILTSNSFYCLAHELLLDAINEIWTTGNFPSSWLESLVIPIPKPGKPPNELTNLRPISLTSNLCKLTERMVLERLMWHIERNYPLHPHQLGFRHGMSTQDILLMLRHQVLDAYSKVQTRTVVAVDVRKAFDTVPHEAIIQSAELAGVCGHLLNFVKSFLNDRTYTIKAGDYIGTAQPNRTGVPQGAVLSPTLFNLVMARLPPLLEAVPSLHFAVYADDGGTIPTAPCVAFSGYDVEAAKSLIIHFDTVWLFEVQDAEDGFTVVMAA